MKLKNLVSAIAFMSASEGLQRLAVSAGRHRRFCNDSESSSSETGLENCFSKPRDMCDTGQDICKVVCKPEKKHHKEVIFVCPPRTSRYERAPSTSTVSVCDDIIECIRRCCMYTKTRDIEAEFRELLSRIKEVLRTSDESLSTDVARKLERLEAQILRIVRDTAACIATGVKRIVTDESNKLLSDQRTAVNNASAAANVYINNLAGLLDADILLAVRNLGAGGLLATILGLFTGVNNSLTTLVTSFVGTVNDSIQAQIDDCNKDSEAKIARAFDTAEKSILKSLDKGEGERDVQIRRLLHKAGNSIECHVRNFLCCLEEEITSYVCNIFCAQPSSRMQIGPQSTFCR